MLVVVQRCVEALEVRLGDLYVCMQLSTIISDVRLRWTNGDSWITR